MKSVLRTRQKLGKYRIERRVAQGGFASVYQAMDTIEGIRVALKIPHPRLLSDDMLSDFRSEVRLMAQLEHENILPLKDASFIDSHFVIVFPLGERSLAERLTNRMSLRASLDFADQMLSAVAYAHSKRVMHCDIKPENFILFSGNRLRLADFGIAKVAYRTVQASGSGTVGYCAPEQAMGKPSFRSDVFSLGLILYRMFAGQLPEWPYDWPPPGINRLRRSAHPNLVQLIRKSIELDPRKRFENAEQLRSAFLRILPYTLKSHSTKSAKRGTETTKRSWKLIRRKQFQREYGKALETRYVCHRCDGPISEPMQACPWCGTRQPVFRCETRFPVQCPRCRRGLKSDWLYCPWCYGPGFEPATTRQYTDVRYSARCSNPDCSRKLLMPFMRYCPWCRRKVQRKWKVPGTNEVCASCGLGVTRSYWDYCPWCGKAIQKT